ncbi:MULTISPECIES: DNA cytosine methyltransferase [unclassified Nitratiruptor]|uniref:DNA cytosine methyltransferase n=1 Tax=unclassified Nitratiruptor TaxID=2624044 RepID=UPI0019159938|nr:MULTISPECIES: DNA cytosine methyltransferase [unclassified Nitratiruptor]BCD59440.1 DNA (cytosine-5)-methyltransferase 1 [Nitratiruptor sp. YY08-10]BCD63364.1 DNA (cytosine-5)-methyltransferase 1 [Nitratiruptor sp. YY08-14]
MEKHIYKIFSTFTGAGGLDLGFHGGFSYLNREYPRLKFYTAKAIEIDKFACKTLKTNTKYFSQTEVINKDINETDPKQYANEDYDVLLGGFPCVTFSIVGKRAGIKDDKNGKLYESFARYLEILRPKVFLAENVKGILSANKGEAIKIIKNRFEIDGYNLKIFLVNFADFGIPQIRERVLFIGIRKDITIPFIPPVPTHTKDTYVSCAEAFKNIPEHCHNNNRMKISKEVEERLKLIPEGGNYKDVENTEFAVKGLMSNIYRRLHRKKPAYTVIASGGGGTWGYHYEEPRPLTNRERARLQGFPDDFIFCGNNTEARRQIGNAVPPAGIYPFAKRIENVLDGIVPEYSPEECLPEYDPETKKFKSLI